MGTLPLVRKAAWKLRFPHGFPPMGRLPGFPYRFAAVKPRQAFPCPRRFSLRFASQALKTGSIPLSPLRVEERCGGTGVAACEARAMFQNMYRVLVLGKLSFKTWLPCETGVAF